MSPELMELVAERFRVLGDPVRIRLLQELEPGEKNVGQLVRAVGSTQPNVSRHLRILQEAGIVGRRPEGNNVYYFLADRGVFELCDAVCASLRDRVRSWEEMLSGATPRGHGSGSASSR